MCGLIKNVKKGKKGTHTVKQKKVTFFCSQFQNKEKMSEKPFVAFSTEVCTQTKEQHIDFKCEMSEKLFVAVSTEACTQAARRAPGDITITDVKALRGVPVFIKFSFFELT